jgi:hypothetical protein
LNRFHFLVFLEHLLKAFRKRQLLGGVRNLCDFAGDITGYLWTQGALRIFLHKLSSRSKFGYCVWGGVDCICCLRFRRRSLWFGLVLS